MSKLCNNGWLDLEHSGQPNADIFPELKNCCFRIVFEAFHADKCVRLAKQGQLEKVMDSDLNV